ncbi:MAG TPA: ECF-type sigma factor, partial [Acidobacteriota bacterium]
LQTTALVNEAYCRLVDQRDLWQNRAHFYGIAAQLMRRILVDHAKSRLRGKRGGGAQKISLNETAFIPESQSSELIRLDDALKQLSEMDPRKSHIVELKFFGGLTMEEIAEVEQLSLRTTEREWRKAKAWLYDAIND